MESYSRFYYVWIIWAHIKYVRFIHIMRSSGSLLILIAVETSIIWIYYNLRIYFTIDGCLHYFLFLAIKNKVSMKTPHICFGEHGRFWSRHSDVKENGGVAFCHGCVKFVMLKREIPIFRLESWMKETFLIHILSLTLPPTSSTLPLSLTILSSSRGWDWRDMNRNEHSRRPKVHVQYSSPS